MIKAKPQPHQTWFDYQVFGYNTIYGGSPREEWHQEADGRWARSEPTMYRGKPNASWLVINWHRP